MKVFVGGKEILHQNHVFIFNNKEKIEFPFDDGYGELTVRCTFETDEDSLENYFDYEKKDDNEEVYELRFLNFNTQGNFPLKKAVPIGTYKKRALYFRCVVEVCNGYKKMDYTWYLK